MIKIKILLGFITLLILVYLLHFMSYIFFQDTHIEITSVEDVTFYLGNPQSNDISGSYTIFGLIQSILIFSGLVISFKCIYGIIKNGFYTSSSKKLMHYVGLAFLCSGIIAISQDGIRFFGNTENFIQLILIGTILMDFILVFIGFIILIISDMSRIGFEIKSENELTI